MKNARSLRILAHNLDVVFETSFDHDSWHNFAVQVDWNALTLGVYFSQDEENLRPVMKKAIKNIGHVATDEGKGDFHFGVLKVFSHLILHLILTDLQSFPLLTPRIIQPKLVMSFIVEYKRARLRHCIILVCLSKELGEVLVLGMVRLSQLLGTLKSM